MKFPKKSLGQNFLIDKNIVNKIIDLINIEDRDIIEIGPGRGALTDKILERKPKTLNLIEKDYNLTKYLREKYSGINNINVFNADILRFNLKNICKKNSAIFGNLPYNISSQIFVKISKLNQWPPKFNDVIFMFQKELGEKIAAKYSDQNYGRISVLTNYRYNIIKKFTVSPTCFRPKPKVTSIVIHFKPKQNNSYNIKKIENLEKITNIFFSNKRKMINKNFKKIFSDAEAKNFPEIKLNSRPSEIKPYTYFKITEFFEKK